MIGAVITQIKNKQTQTTQFLPSKKFALLNEM